MKHLNDRELSALTDGALSGEALWRAQQHLEKCGDCREALAALSARDAALDTALAHDPGEAYFATFADRVVGRIAESERAGEAESPARGAAAERGDMLRAPIRLPWWQSPRGLAVASTAVVVVAGAGIVLLSARQAEFPMARRAESPAAGATEQPEASSPMTAAPPSAPLAPQGSEGAQQLEPSATPSHDQRGANESQVGVRSEREQGRRDLAAPAPLAAEPPAPAPAAVRDAGSTRMQAVPRGAPGEERSPAPAGGFAAPPRTTGSSSPEQKLRELKRAALAPAGQQDAAAKSATAKERDEARAASESMPVTGSAAADAATSTTALRTTCGVVRDDAGRPLAGVTVSATGVAATATTGADGRFCLALPPGPFELQLLAVGFRPLRLTAPGEERGSDLVVTLNPVAVLGNTGLASRSRVAAEAPASLSLGEAPLRAFPDSLRGALAEATRLQARAAASGNASNWDAAAVAWERIAATAPPGAAEVEVHARIAESRHEAWRRAPDARRASRAVEALTRYVTRAPAGDRRDLAARWIDQIRTR